MNDNRRSHPAFSLRTFFDEQIHHLHDLVGNLSIPIHHDEKQQEDGTQDIESFVDASNSKIRAVYDYTHKLREHVTALHSHVCQIAEAIPPPIVLNRETFRTDPIVNALFADRKEIDKLFKTDPDVDAFLRTHNHVQTPVLYALLTANKNEKSTLGIGMLGEMLVRDVPQQVVNFSSHKIHTPCTSSVELSMALHKYLFDRIVALVKQEMTSRMTNQLFKPGDHSYQSRLNSLANPDVYLDTLIKHIENPTKLLSIDKTHFKLSKLGIKLGDDDMQCANEFEIYELIWNRNTRNVMLQISYLPKMLG